MTRRLCLRSIWMVLLAICILLLPSAAFARRLRHVVSPQATPDTAGLTLDAGSLRLTRCPPGPAYCGMLARPLDPAGQVSGTIGIAFAFFPHHDRSQPALETIVASEG